VLQGDDVVRDFSDVAERYARCFIEFEQP